MKSEEPRGRPAGLGSCPLGLGVLEEAKQVGNNWTVRGRKCDFTPRVDLCAGPRAQSFDEPSGGIDGGIEAEAPLAATARDR